MRKTNVINYVIDSFINYKGKEQKFILCCLTKEPDVVIVDKEDYETYQSCFIKYVDSYSTFRQLHLGISFCNSCDEFNEELGKKIALGKAEISIPKLVATEPGIINKALVDALIKQEITFIKNNPGKFIAGYDEKKSKYDAEQVIKSELKSLSEDEFNVIEAINKEVNIDKCIKLATYLHENSIDTSIN